MDFQIKKVSKEQNTIKMRKGIEKMELSKEFFTIERQLSIMETLYNDVNNKDNTNNNTNNKSIDKNTYETIHKEVEKKLSSYKQQDILKNRLDHEKFINKIEVIDKLHTSKMSCYYCNEHIFILYDIVHNIL